MKYTSKFTGPEIDDKLTNAAMKSDYTPTTELSGKELNLPVADKFENYGSCYFKDADGTVTVTINIVGIIEALTGVIIATLPVGYRPATTYVTCSNASNDLGLIQINSTGKIYEFSKVRTSNVRANITFKAAN